MRFVSFPAFIRTLYAFSFSYTTASAAAATARHTSARTGLHSAPYRLVVLRSMPTIPFLSSLFSSSSASQDMEYPVKKSDDEWRAVLNKGTQAHLQSLKAPPF